MELNKQQKALYGLKIKQIEELIEGQKPTEKKGALVHIDQFQPIIRTYFQEKYLITKTGVNVFSFVPKTTLTA